LETVEKLKSLQYLVIANCPGMTKDRIISLERVLPDCRIVSD
jgi:hypothetical protein